MKANFSLNIDGELLTLNKPAIMGIINATPDSFYARSRKEDLSEIIETAGEMLEAGAHFLDIGGYSSRPGANDISASEEMDRVLPCIEAIKKNFSDSIITIDTFRSQVASESIRAGASGVNDISGGHLDPKMLEIVAETKAFYIAMHMKGTPQNMTTLTKYDDLLLEIFEYFGNIKKQAHQLGITDLIVDPGIGFAKTIDQNYYVLKHLEYFKKLECPILVGVSRKSMIYKLLQTEPDKALNGTTVLNTIALMKGANILRVHDVRETKELVTLFEKLNATEL